MTMRSLLKEIRKIDPRQIQHNTTHSRPTSRHIATERTRDRVTTRTVEVFNDLNGIYLRMGWFGVIG